MSFFDGANPFVIDRPVRLIELFAGIGAQAKAVERLGIEHELYRVSEWDVYNAYGNCDVLLQSGTGNNCEFAGGINVKGENGVNVSRAVSARDLKWWGDLTATGEQTRIKPRSRQNALYTDWQYWKSVDGVSYWVLTGKGTPW